MTDQKVKARNKPEKIPFRLIKGALVPADKFAESTLRDRKYSNGDILFGVITKPRNPKFNRLVHKIGVLCVENIESFEGMDAHMAIKRLQLESRVECDEIGFHINGYPEMTYQIIPRSISFNSMGEERFQNAAKAICRHIAAKYWPSLSADAVEKMAEVEIHE